MKRTIVTTALALAMVVSAGPAAFADPDKDESGHGRWHGDHGREYKEEYRDGDCKVERKWEKNGDYKEERKCKGHRRPPVVYYEDRPEVYVVPGRPEIYREPPSGGWINPSSAPGPVLVPRGGNVLTCNRDVIGSILGGAAGGVLGSQIGKGDGRLAATAAGTLVGVLIGGEIGRTMDRLDQVCAGQALEQVQANQVVNWQNPNGAAYEVKPVQTYQDRSGRSCRDFISTVTIDGRPQQGYATACRQPDGGWQIVG